MRFVRAAAEHLPFAGGAFDLVVSKMSLHHWRDQAAGLAEIGRVLASGGALVLADQFAASWQRIRFALLRRRDRHHSAAENERLLNRADPAIRGWDVVFRLGPLPLVVTVSATKR